MMSRPRYPGVRITANGNQLVSYHTETRIADAGVFYPITPSTEGGELYQQAFAEGKLNAFGRNTIAIEAEGEHAAQGGAIAHSVCGKRVVNYTSGQGVVYGVEQYYHAPGKCSTMVLEVAARALTKHALNVHCGHDDVYGALDTGWIIAFGKDAQQAADQALILRRVTELSLTPGMDWFETRFKGVNTPYRYTVAHWCATEARFRNHLKKVKPEDLAKMIPLENMLVRITQQDVVYRRYLVSSHRSYVPDFGVYISIQGANGQLEFRSLSRQLVLFCVERRKAWRLLQSKAGIENREYKAQRALLADVDAGKIAMDDFFAHADRMLKERMPAAAAHKPAAPAIPAPPAATAATAAAAATSTVTH